MPCLTINVARLSLGVLGLACLLAGPARADDPSVRVERAWARATPGPVRTGAAYLTVTSMAGDHLVSAQTPVAGRAEIHSMTMDGAVMKMRAVPGGLDVPAGKPLVLAPDGYHLMLMELKQPLKQGENFPLTLHFAKAGDVQTMVSVERAGAMGPAGATAPAMSGGMKM